MVDESIVRTRLIADLIEAGIPDPDRYFESRQSQQLVKPSLDEISAVYGQRMADLCSACEKQFRNLQEAFENSREELIEWQKAQAQIAQRIEQLPSKQ